ncbi:MAG: 1-acyl-sn-glycerol-3-phosphate acyltransferase [Bacteroidetes bacterium]|nr:1-acyl-sn-glycerol-3-phosphate acyltransferase [Bacteroidota bacterium]
MFYTIMWNIANLALRFYFRHLFVSNATRVPNDKPVILACNHPNSFMDAILFATHTRRPLNFFARSDAFKTNFMKAFLGALHLNPIYRQEEGKENLMKNDQTFNRGYSLLKEKGMVLVHSEGICVVEKRLRKLKKGTARMAFFSEANENFRLDLQIVPVGFNYTYPTKFRGEVMITIGEPFTTEDFREVFEENPAKAINLFNAKLSGELEKVVIIIEEKKNEPLTENLFIIFRNNDPEKAFRWRTDCTKRFVMEKSVADIVNRSYKESSGSFTELYDETMSYFKRLGALRISDSRIANGVRNTFGAILALLIAFPFFFTGAVASLLPAWLTGKITKSTVKGDVFYASVMFGAGVFVSLICYFLVLVFTAIFAPWWIFLSALFLPAFSYVFVLYIDLFRFLKGNIRYIIARSGNAEAIKSLKEQRQKILRLIHNAR